MRGRPGGAHDGRRSASSIFGKKGRHLPPPHQPPAAPPAAVACRPSGPPAAGGERGLPTPRAQPLTPHPQAQHIALPNHHVAFGNRVQGSGRLQLARHWIRWSSHMKTRFLSGLHPALPQASPQAAPAATHPIPPFGEIRGDGTLWTPTPFGLLTSSRPHWSLGSLTTSLQTECFDNIANTP
jgi:hypothetical protein